MPEAAIAPEVENRRDQIAAMFDNAENGEPLVAEPEPQVAAGEPAPAERVRDESGRFAPKPKAEAAPVVEPPPVAAQPAPAPAAAPEPAPTPSLTTWRKEYLPIQQKLEKGESLSADEAKKLAAYNVERERQYSAGIAGFKGEAAQAKHLTEAMSEFLPILQQHNMNPATWIQNLGRAHATLALGSPEQKLQMFSRLAQDYGVPLGAVSQAQAGQVDPVMLQLMQELQNVKQNLSGITSWRQQQEAATLNQEVAKFSDTTKYPHFEQVREKMAQLLESNVAQNPDEAYHDAVWLNPELRQLEMAKLTPAPAAVTPPRTPPAAVAKAKATGTQVRTSAPSGAPANTQAKDRRSALAAALEAADVGGRV